VKAGKHRREGYARFGGQDRQWRAAQGVKNEKIIKKGCTVASEPTEGGHAFPNTRKDIA